MLWNFTYGEESEDDDDGACSSSHVHVVGLTRCTTTKKRHDEL